MGRDLGKVTQILMGGDLGKKKLREVEERKTLFLKY